MAGSTFWYDKQGMVTGGAGFLGSCVVAELQARSAASIVIQLAARVGGIGANREKPARFFCDNLMMGVQLLHEGWYAGVDKFVAVGTVCAHPKHTPVPFREDDLWAGCREETNAPHGLAKQTLLVQSQVYCEQYGFRSIFLLPINLYGPGDNFDLGSSHVLPALIRKCLDGQEEADSEIVAWIRMRDACFLRNRLCL